MKAHEPSVWVPACCGLCIAPCCVVSVSQILILPQQAAQWKHLFSFSPNLLLPFHGQTLTEQKELTSECFEGSAGLLDLEESSDLICVH